MTIQDKASKRVVVTLPGVYKSELGDAYECFFTPLIVDETGLARRYSSGFFYQRVRLKSHNILSDQIEIDFAYNFETDTHISSSVLESIAHANSAAKQSLQEHPPGHFGSPAVQRLVRYLRAAGVSQVVNRPTLSFSYGDIADRGKSLEVADIYSQRAAEMLETRADLVFRAAAELAVVI